MKNIIINLILGLLIWQSYSHGFDWWAGVFGTILIGRVVWWCHQELGWFSEHDHDRWLDQQ